MNTLLDVRDLSKRYGQTMALHPTNLQVERGEFVTILGASGCGKSTLLGLLMGISTHDGGEIHLAGQRIDALPPERRDVAMVFQSYALFPHMSVRRNLAFGLKMKKVPAAEQKKRISHAVDACGLGAYVDRMPGQLSGGQQQRVALARAIVMRAPLMLYDEPLSSLDATLRESLRHEIVALHRQTDSAALYVTHDHIEAMTMADRVVMMQAGRIVETGTPLSLYREPRLRSTAALLGAGNLVDVEVDLANGAEAAWLPSGQQVPLANPGCVKHERRVTVLIRPEAIQLTPDARSAGIVTETRFVGGVVHYLVDLGGLSLRAIAIGSNEPFAPGTRVDVRIEAPLHVVEDLPVPSTPATANAMAPGLEPRR